MIQSVTSFGDQLVQAVELKGNPVCVGLDPRLPGLPSSLRPESGSSPEAIADAFQQFCFEIIDVVASVVPIVKPQVAFFEQYGPAGMMALHRVIQYANRHGLLVIADAKRNDIGSTAEAYAEAFLGRGIRSAFGSDAVTVSPYLGEDSLSPFVNRAIQTNSGVSVLVKTSNPGSGFIQDLEIDQLSVSERIADWVQSQAVAQFKQETSVNEEVSPDNQALPKGYYGSIGAVVGATYPAQLELLRQRMPNAWLLIPGYGAQGGNASDIASGFDAQGLGAIVNNSRGIIFAHQSEKYRDLDNWQLAVERSTGDMIDSLRTHTSVGKISLRTDCIPLDGI